MVWELICQRGEAWRLMGSVHPKSLGYSFLTGLESGMDGYWKDETRSEANGVIEYQIVGMAPPLLDDSARFQPHSYG